MNGHLLQTLDSQDLGRIVSERELFKRVFDAIPFQIAVKSAEAATQGQFLIWNRTAENQLGLKESEVLGKTDHDFFPREEADFFTRKDLEVIESGQPLDIPEEPIHGASGEIFYLHTVKTPIFDESGKVVALLAVSEDITNGREREEALRDSEERWNLALAGSQAGVWDWNIREDAIFYSDRWQMIYGYHDGDLPVNSAQLLDLIHPEDRPTFEERLRAHLEGETDTFECEHRNRHKDGRYVWSIAYGKVQFDESDKPIRMIGTISDISERKRAEQELVKAKETAEQASRVKSDFLAMMSHEIRTPLNGVLGFADLLVDTGLNSSQQEYARTIQECGSSLLTILNDILDFSKVESGQLSLEREPIAVRGLVTSAVEVFATRAAEKRITLSVAVADDVPFRVIGDAVRLKQIISNLISNAVKFTGAGDVLVTVDRREGGGAGKVSLCLTVTDSGMGISSENLQKLFRPFSQGDASMSRRFGGTGLGLAIVRRLVSLMGGQITVESEPMKGTRFAIDLDFEMVHERSEPALAKHGSNGTGSGLAERHPLEILVVDDNPINARLTRLILERMGYQPEEAGDGYRAIEMAGGKDYDVILMDIQMPGIDGYQTAERIRCTDRAKSARIVAMTAHAMQTDHDRSMAQGFFGHLTKPIRTRELAETLEAIGRERVES